MHVHTSRFGVMRLRPTSSVLAARCNTIRFLCASVDFGSQDVFLGIAICWVQETYPLTLLGFGCFSSCRMHIIAAVGNGYTLGMDTLREGYTHWEWVHMGNG